MSVQNEVKRICNLVLDNGGTAWVVGGASRDLVMYGSMDNVKDFDIEVFGISPQELILILGMYYEINLVGQSFGVVKLRGLPIDVSIPRRESKSGTGHTGFEVYSDPSMSVEEAALRRDFTINSIYYNPVLNVFNDPYRGINDIYDKKLRPVSERFKEDPLRVLRAMQFIARFNLEATQELLHYCYDVGIENLSKERIFGEWSKLLLKGHQIGNALNFLVASKWIHFFPELAALQGIQQDPSHHPEGDAFVHTCHVMDAFAASREGNDFEDLVVGFAALTHDFGKATHTKFEDGKWKSHGHEEASVPLARQFLKRLTNEDRLIYQVLPLVADHMSPRLLYTSGASDSAIRRLSLRVNGRLDLLTKLSKLDRLGRPPLNPEFSDVEWLLSRAAALSVRHERPKPIIMGRHLIQLGLKPGPEMGRILAEVFEAQLEGEIVNEAGGLALAQQLIPLNPKTVELVPATELADE
jgi:tRNA nucleotidyltransferase (CCA-adding enzyme)